MDENDCVIIIRRREYCDFEASVFRLVRQGRRGMTRGAHVFHGSERECQEFVQGRRCVGTTREAINVDDLFDLELRWGRMMDEAGVP